MISSRSALRSDGKLAEYGDRATQLALLELQKYLIELHGERLQAFGIAWNSRPKEKGGKRWFHLYPNENIDA